MSKGIANSLEQFLSKFKVFSDEVPYKRQLSPHDKMCSPSLLEDSSQNQSNHKNVPTYRVQRSSSACRVKTKHNSPRSRRKHETRALPEPRFTASENSCLEIKNNDVHFSKTPEHRKRDGRKSKHYKLKLHKKNSEPYHDRLMLENPYSSNKAEKRDREYHTKRQFKRVSPKPATSTDSDVTVVTKVHFNERQWHGNDMQIKLRTKSESLPGDKEFKLTSDHYGECLDRKKQKFGATSASNKKKAKKFCTFETGIEEVKRNKHARSGRLSASPISKRRKAKNVFNSSKDDNYEVEITGTPKCLIGYRKAATANSSDDDSNFNYSRKAQRNRKTQKLSSGRVNKAGLDLFRENRKGVKNKHIVSDDDRVFVYIPGMANKKHQHTFSRQCYETHKKSSKGKPHFLKNCEECASSEITDSSFHSYTTTEQRNCLVQDTCYSGDASDTEHINNTQSTASGSRHHTSETLSCLSSSTSTISNAFNQRGNYFPEQSFFRKHSDLSDLITAEENGVKYIDISSGIMGVQNKSKRSKKQAFHNFKVCQSDQRHETDYNSNISPNISKHIEEEKKKYPNTATLDIQKRKHKSASHTRRKKSPPPPRRENMPIALSRSSSPRPSKHTSNSPTLILPPQVFMGYHLAPSKKNVDRRNKY